MSDAADELEIPTVVSSDRRYTGRILDLRVDTLREAGGTSYTREIISYGEAVVLVPIDDAGQVLMVRQYRHAVGAWLLELPAGGIDERDATPEEAALRELREETGHRGSLRKLGAFFLAPGYSDELQHIYAATDLVEDALDADEDEDLRLERARVDDVLRMIDGGEIRDAKSIAAMMLFTRAAGASA
jgi:ADP-ribose pyrophosphatase